MRRGWGSRGADLRRRAPGGGGEGAGPGSLRAALAALQCAWRPRLSADALGPARGCRRLSPASRRRREPEAVAAPRGNGAGGLHLPGSSAQRWVSKLMRGGPEHHVPGRPPGAGASGVGIRWPGGGGEGSVI